MAECPSYSAERKLHFPQIPIDANTEEMMVTMLAEKPRETFNPLRLSDYLHDIGMLNRI